jgi:hypothetical protein
MKKTEHKLQVLTENYNAEESNKQMTLKEFVEYNASNDPNFYRWLLDADLNNDFDMSLTDDQKDEYRQFLSTL